MVEKYFLWFIVVDMKGIGFCDIDEKWEFVFFMLVVIDYGGCFFVVYLWVEVEVCGCWIGLIGVGGKSLVIVLLLVVIVIIIYFLGYKL